MNIFVKLFRDITRQFIYLTKKETRYKATMIVKTIGKGSSLRIPVLLKDCPDNNNYYEVLTYKLPDYVDFLRGVDAPIKKSDNRIEIISTFEVEIKQKVYY